MLAHTLTHTLCSERYECEEPLAKWQRKNAFGKCYKRVKIQILSVTDSFMYQKVIL